MSSGLIRTQSLWRRIAPPAVGGLLAFVLLARVLGAVVTGLEQRGFVLLHQCVPGGGPLAWIGAKLAVVHAAGDCPVGTYALGGRPDDVVAVVAAVALPVVVLHLLAGFAGLGTAAYLNLVLTRSSALVRARLCAVLPALPSLVREVTPGVVVSENTPAPRSPGLLLVPARRGPPCVAAF